MRILCLTSRLPYPPNRGDRLRAFHFIEHLAQKHELSLVSFIADEDQRQHLTTLEAFCRTVQVVPMRPRSSAAAVARNLWRREPLQALYYRSRAMGRLVAQSTASTRFDAAYVHLFRMAPYMAGYRDLYRVVDLTDVISKEIDLSLPYRGLTSRLLYRLEKPRIARYERWVARTFEESWLISEADRRILAATCPGANVQVVPNGVDMETFRPMGRAPVPNSLIFVGHLRVFHNVDAARYLVGEIMPLVRRQVPACKVEIVGANPAPSVQALAEAPGVSVPGFVEDLNQALNQASVFVAPLRFAAGVQNKVLEAMAAGRPVVTTGAIADGLGAVPGRDLLTGEDAQALAGEIVRLLGDGQLQATLGQAGRRFVRENYSWSYAVERMGTIEEMLKARRMYKT
jgi:sugar transferase (PEP-CTERM/EpsH1 system associated)